MTSSRNYWIRYAGLVILAVAAAVAFGLRGASVRMLTKGRVYVLNSGEEIRLECEFHADYFNLFDNPILWRKIQMEEETQINMMGNLMEPFESSRRFKVTFTQKPSSYLLTLYIAETYQEDSGNYSCEVNGPQNTLLGYVAHHIFIRAPIDSLSIEGGTPTEGDRPEVVDVDRWTERRIVFRENSPSTLQCIASGGYPPPDVAIQLGNDDVTNQMSLSHSVRLVGNRSLRLMHYRTIRGLRNYNAHSIDDGKQIRCAVTVAGLMSNFTFARIIVHYAPIITCEQSHASIGDRDAYVRCHVRSKPDMTATFWIIDVNGTTLAEGEVINEYWSSVMYRSDGIFEMQLSLREAKPESFRKYTIVAENSVGVRTKDVCLMPKPAEQAPQTKARDTPEIPQAREESRATSHPLRKEKAFKIMVNGQSRTKQSTTMFDVATKVTLFVTVVRLLNQHHHHHS